MSADNVRAFFKRIEEDETFRNEFLKSESLDNENKDSYLKIAAAMGYSFTAEELEQTKAEMDNEELSDDELDNVAGGAIHTSKDGCISSGYVSKPGGGERRDAWCLFVGFS